jgi:hypothetical protein
MQFARDSADTAAASRVEHGAWFVEQEDGRAHGEHACDGHPLTLAP